MSINTALGVRDTPAVTVRTRSGKDGNGPEAKENDFDPDLDGIEDEVQARFSAEQEEIIATAKASIDECIGKGKVVKSVKLYLQATTANHYLDQKLIM